MERPVNPYVVRRENRWIVCEDADGPQGFAIKVRQYLTNAERDDLVTDTNEIHRYSADYLTASIEERPALEERHGGTPRDLEWRHLAPYILEWNAAGETAKGDVEPIPPPAEGGPDVFLLITPEQYSWIYAIVVRGYRSMGKAGSWRDG